MSGNGATRPPRDHRLDFFRGLALFFIFVDHIPDNPAADFTLAKFALCDAAEVFILISGYTAALVYGRAFTREGGLLASLRIWRRVWQLYVAHLMVFLAYSAQVAYAASRMTNPLYIEHLGLADFLERADQTLLRVLTLQFQPTYLDILPLYIALLLVFPLVLLVMRAHVGLAVGLSAAVYAAVQAWGFNLPGNPEADGWYFNPFAWQFLFVLGAALGFSRARAPEREMAIPGWLVGLAAATVAFGLVVQVSWTLHEHVPAIPALLRRQLWPVDKTLLAPPRLANVLALAILVARFIARDSRLLTGRLGWPIAVTGQKSLDVFCLGILLSVLGGIVLTEFGYGAGPVAAVNLGGALAMLGLAHGIAWYEGGGHLPTRPDAAEAAR